MTTTDPVGVVLADDRHVLTVDETAAILRLNRRTAYDAVNRGDIPSVRLGKRLLVPVAALNAMLGATAPAVAVDTDAIAGAVEAAVRDALPRAIRDAFRADGNNDV